jgi:putative thioredoxin
MIHDVDESGFEQAVIERSRQVPVVVDFWAEWCGPCRQLTPALESEARSRGDDVDLVKIDVDANQALAQRFGVQGIPAVKAFKDGAVAAEFTGAVPPAQVAAFFSGLVPSEADRLAGSDEEADLRRALELDPRQDKAAIALARMLLDRGDNAETSELLEPFSGDFLAAGLAARAKLAEGDGDETLAAAFADWDAGRHEQALEALQEAVAATGPQDGDRRDLLRRVMVAIFTELGPESELARAHRRRLALSLT